MTAQVIQRYDRDGGSIETLQRPGGETYYRSCAHGLCRYSSDLWQAEIYLDYLLAQAGVSNLRVHDLRHSFASYALSSGQSLGVVGQLLGHRSAQTTTRYAHLTSDAAQAAVAKVSADLGM